MINLRRATDYFISIAKIHSPSRSERNLATRLAADFKELGFKACFDATGKKIDGDCGNLILKYPGSGPGISKQPVLLCAHMDTVQPSAKVTPVLKSSSVIESNGDTILGADDKAGIALIYEVVRSIVEKKHPCTPLEILFTVCEEEGLLGSANLEPQFLSAKRGFVLDSDHPSAVHFKAAGVSRFRISIKGRSAHSGTSPQTGINAIAIGAESIAKFDWGRIDSDTTANIALVKGGRAINQVPDLFEMDVEIRSLRMERIRKTRNDLLEEVRRAIASFKLRDGTKARYSVKDIQSYKPMRVATRDEFFHQFLQIARQKFPALRVKPYTGGFDGNYLQEYGIKTVNISTGAREIHSPSEWLDLKEFETVGNLMMSFLLRYSGSPQSQLSIS